MCYKICYTFSLHKSDMTTNWIVKIFDKPKENFLLGTWSNIIVQHFSLSIPINNTQKSAVNLLCLLAKQSNPVNTMRCPYHAGKAGSDCTCNSIFSKWMNFMLLNAMTSTDKTEAKSHCLFPTMRMQRCRTNDDRVKTYSTQVILFILTNLLDGRL